MKQGLSIIAFVALAACSAPETTRRTAPTMDLPPMKTFSQVIPTPPRNSNSIIARDFLDLVFTLENGEEMAGFTRFEGPITIAVSGKSPPSLTRDLDRLIERLRREAGLRISRVSGDRPASITIAPVTRAQIQRVAPSAACFVRPNVSSWDEYRARRNDPATFWNRLSERRKMAVFLPVDVSPQEIRDCLHEEVSQALGPVNDLYRLSESIFNDDNFHTVLTGYDMLILRAYYDDDLRNGMTKSEVAARLPAILARLNPAGGWGGIAPPYPDFSAWEAAIERATTPRTSKARRRAAAERAIDLASGFGMNDSRLAFSYYVLGRLALSTDPDQALGAFLASGRIYQNRPDSAIQEAHVAMQVAAFQLSAGRADVAMALVDQNMSVVLQSEHAALLSLLLLVKAEALELLDRPQEAREVQKDALAWARYGFGDETEIRQRVGEILAISPRSRQGNPA
jgi:Protein of unknown function (DUF2927)